MEHLFPFCVGCRGLSKEIGHYLFFVISNRHDIPTLLQKVHYEVVLDYMLQVNMFSIAYDDWIL